jgi:uncharacterized integral membrane protein (TIGR00697 family)
MLSREPRPINLKYIIPLAMIYLTIYLAADSVAYKMVSIWGTLEPGPPFIFPLSYAIADIIAEVYGYSQAKKILFLTLLFQFMYAFFVTFVVKLPIPDFWTMQSAYDQVFGNLFRFVSAGFLAVLSSHFINIYIFSKLKMLLNGKYFFIRSFVSSSIGGFILIAVIMIFGYSGSINFHDSINMFLSIYCLELLFACITAWPSWLISGFLKIKEQLDVYDTTTNFNPFNFN